MKLSSWAKKKGITYRTAWSWFKDGKIPNASQMPSGTILIDEIDKLNLYNQNDQVAIYARVSNSENKKNLKAQTQRLQDYCAARGYCIIKVVEEIGSGLNDKRPKLEGLLLDKKIKKIVVEHNDRLSRFGLNYLQKLLALDNRGIEVINLQENDRDDLMQDFVSIITSFVARLYGQRRSKRKTEKIIEKLSEEKEDFNPRKRKK